MTLLTVKQKLIDEKNWEELFKTDIFYDFDFNNNSWKLYDLNSEFFTEFYFEKDYLFMANKGASGHTRIVFYDDILKKGIAAAANSKNNFSTETWKYILDNIIKVSSRLGETESISIIFTVKNIDSTPNIGKAILALKSKLIGFKIYQINTNFIVGLSKEEIIEFIEFCQSIAQSNSPMIIEDKPKFLTALPKQDLIDIFVLFRQKLRMKLSDIIIDLSETEFLDILDKNTGNLIESETIEILRYYPINNIKLPDKKISTIFDLMESTSSTDGVRKSDFIPSMSEESIREHKIYFSLRKLAENNLDMELINEFSNDLRVDISNSRFFTEDEIAKYPHLFDPRTVKANINLYVSKETFTKLNKRWQLRQRYQVELSDMGKIFVRLKKKDRTLKTLKYLIEKSDATSEQIIKLISITNISAKEENAIIFRHLFNKYK